MQGTHPDLPAMKNRRASQSMSAIALFLASIVMTLTQGCTTQEFYVSVPDKVPEKTEGLIVDDILRIHLPELDLAVQMQNFHSKDSVPYWPLGLWAFGWSWIPMKKKSR